MTMDRLIQFFRSNFGSVSGLVGWGINTGIYLTISGLYASRFLIACGMIVMGCASLLNALTMPGIQFRRRWEHILPFIPVAILMLLSVLSTFVGSDVMDFAYVRLRLYAAFLLMPLILGYAPEVSVVQLKNYLLFAVSAACITTLAVWINYFLNSDAILTSMGRGKPIPTPIPHIRFGMFVCFAFLGSIYALLNKWYPRKWSLFILIGALYLGGIILFLSIRTAWLITLVGMMVMMIQYFYLRKKLIRIIPALGIILVVAAMAFMLIPSVRMKVGYSIYDFKSWKAGKGDTYSDSERIYSLRNGWLLWKENKMWGVGSGDLRRAMEENGLKYHISGDQIPHNQWLMVMVCGGLVSLFLFMAALTYLWILRRHKKLFIFNLAMVLYCITFLFEPTFETSIGVLSFVFVITMILLVEYQRNFDEMGESVRLD